MEALGWDRADFVLVSGDAYVDHPSFGVALIGRSLQRAGYRVALMCQPDLKDAKAFSALGRPAIAFLVTAGNIDSMVNHYTAAKRPRAGDAYSKDGASGRRPDRASIVYCNRIRQAHKNAVIVLGGVEASLRRIAHYDYWDDAVRRSILVDSGADLLIYGMAERTMAQAAALLKSGDKEALNALPGTCVALAPQEAAALEGVDLPSFEEVSADKKAYARAFAIFYREQDPVRGRRLRQACGRVVLVHNPPAMPLSRRELDETAALPFMREAHPDFAPVPALQEVQFSIAATRGCFGACSFCALTSHQGRIVTSRSPDSIVREAELLAGLRDFKGYIHDIGGPTANFRRPACDKQLTSGACRDRQCLSPTPCKNLVVEHEELLSILRRARKIPGVKKAFIRSGLRYDYLLADKNREQILAELAEHHISGQLKVAPEHVDPGVLRAMGKPPCEVFDQFRACYQQANRKAGREQYLVPYFISGHPGSDLSAAVRLAQYMKSTGLRPEQVQDFYPTPGTLATAMYHTGIHPLSGKPVHVPRDPAEKAMQRALLQFHRKENYPLVRKALLAAGRSELIGYGKECLAPPAIGQAIPQQRKKPIPQQRKKR